MYAGGNLVKEIFTELFSSKSNAVLDLLDRFHFEVDSVIKTVDISSLCLIDKSLLNEIQKYENDINVQIRFGSALSDIQCCMRDANFRQHVICVEYKSYQKLLVKSTQLPHAGSLEREYNNLDEIVAAFRELILDLTPYFHQLELIDRNCTVKEPRNPSFKDDYRKILIDDRIWLHVEVTSEGLANNLHLIGQSEFWQNKLQDGLINWDHDRDIIENISQIFDIEVFPQCERSQNTDIGNETDSQVCSICLCVELPDVQGVPQPLCSNLSCGAYFHRTCLHMWLVTSARNRPQTFGVASGSCPSCLQAISCNEKEI